MTDKEVMQMALDWFHWFQHGTNPNGAHVLEVEEALRTALAQPEPEPVAWEVWTIHNHIFFSIGVQSFQINDVLEHQPEVLAEEFSEWLATQLRHALTQLSNTAPPKKEWVGLTDQEHMQLATEWGCMSADWVLYAAAVERKVKEKNA